MSTKNEIIRVGDELIREKGVSAFSYNDIAKRLTIKNASIHYYFPTKADLCVAIVNEHKRLMGELIQRCEHLTPVEKLEQLISTYSHTREEEKLCIVGTLSCGFYTVEGKVKEAISTFADLTLKWVTSVLEEGKERGIFHFSASSRTQALLLVTNLLAALQLSRITGKEDFYTIKQAIFKELIIEI